MPRHTRVIPSEFKPDKEVTPELDGELASSGRSIDDEYYAGRKAGLIGHDEADLLRMDPAYLNSRRDQCIALRERQRLHRDLMQAKIRKRRTADRDQR